MRCGHIAQIRSCPRNCKRRASAECHWASPGRRRAGDDPRSQETCRHQLNAGAGRGALDRFLRVGSASLACAAARTRESMLVGVRRLDDEAPTEIPQGAGAAVTVVVCATCRDASRLGCPSAPRRAARRGDRRAATGSGVATARVACLGNCKRRLTAAIFRTGGWSYVFGDLDRRQRAPTWWPARCCLPIRTDGFMPWRGRPRR